ncbi:MAG TPA: hypothetical protein VGM39_13255 [Kofleriaceae bacterium]|jgi:hypothetical protein
MITNKLFVAALGLSLAFTACSKKTETTKTDDKAAPVADKPTDKPADKPADPPPPAPSGPSADESKEYLGLDLQPFGKWKTEWDPDAKVAKWTNDDLMTGIVIRVVKDKLDTVDDLKEAAPMMMQVGTAITAVTENKTTDKGWYSVSTYDDGKSTVFLYVRKFGGSQIVCSANITPVKEGDMGAGGIKKEDAMKACESVKPKG